MISRPDLLLRHAAATAAVLVLTACGTGDAPAGDDRAARDSPAANGAAHDMGGMRMDDAMMQRHADELEAVTLQVREHVREMRRRTPAEWHARMGEHTRHISEFLNLVNRQMREMDMGMGMDDEQMGGMMGMSGEEHRRMMEEMQALRTEAEVLRTATEAELRDRIPAHLARLEGFVERMELSAAHMRAV
jgi:hypothetical protein